MTLHIGYIFFLHIFLHIKHIIGDAYFAYFLHILHIFCILLYILFCILFCILLCILCILFCILHTFFVRIILHILHIFIHAYCAYLAYCYMHIMHIVHTHKGKCLDPVFHCLLPLLLGPPSQGPAVYVPPPLTITTAC